MVIRVTHQATTPRISGHDNSILLSGILNRYQTAGSQKALELLMRISPVAWQHIHILGHYAFRDKQHPIDLEAILACVNLLQRVDSGCWGTPNIVLISGNPSPVRCYLLMSN